MWDRWKGYVPEVACEIVFVDRNNQVCAAKVGPNDSIWHNDTIIILGLRTLEHLPQRPRTWRDRIRLRVTSTITAISLKLSKLRLGRKISVKQPNTLFVEVEPIPTFQELLMIINGIPIFEYPTSQEIERLLPYTDEEKTQTVYWNYETRKIWPLHLTKPPRTDLPYVKLTVSWSYGVLEIVNIGLNK